MTAAVARSISLSSICTEAGAASTEGDLLVLTDSLLASLVFRKEDDPSTMLVSVPHSSRPVTNTLWWWWWC